MIFTEGGLWLTTSPAQHNAPALLVSSAPNHAAENRPMRLYVETKANAEKTWPLIAI